MSTESKRPFVHELSANPFHIDRPWYEVGAKDAPSVSGPIIILCSDGKEREATMGNLRPFVGQDVVFGGIEGPEIKPSEVLPDGVTIKKWRIP